MSGRFIGIKNIKGRQEFMRMILKTAEDEVKIIQMVFDRYIHTNDGINGVANYLNNHGL